MTESKPPRGNVAARRNIAAIDTSQPTPPTAPNQPRFALYVVNALGDRVKLWRKFHKRRGFDRVSPFVCSRTAGVHRASVMKCVAFKTLERGSLQGFADLMMDSGLVLLGCTLHEMNNKRWVNPPSRPALTAERTLLYEGGKLVYVPVVEFIDSTTRFHWSRQAVEAVDRFLDGKAPAAKAGAMSIHGEGATR